MPTSKKPKKKYVKKVMAGGHIPIPAKLADEAELSALMALSAIKEGFFDKRIGLELVQFLHQCLFILQHQEEKAQKIFAMYKALDSIHDRWARVGKWGATGDELKVLSLNLPPILEAYRGASKSKALAAENYANQVLRRAQSG